MKHDVIVIGAGPVGATAALLLAQHGLSVGLAEGRTTPSARLGAVSVDDEALRIWQSCGLEHLITPFWASGTSGDPMCKYQDARGRVFLTLRQSISDLGYPHAVVIHQASLLETLWNQINRVPAISFMKGTELTSLTQSDGEVIVQLRDGHGSMRELSASHLVACDGSRSRARQLAGISMPILDLPGHWLVVDIEDDPGQHVVDIRCSTDDTAVTVPIPGGLRRIEKLLPNHDANDWIDDDQQVRARLEEFWPRARDSRIIDRSIFRFSAGIAERWKVGRVFLAGDAAHVTPPFAGQGLGMGLRDASNLSFKIAGVNHGWLNEDVLVSYEQERLPHQQRVLNLALRLGRLMTPSSRWRSSVEQSLVRVLSECEPVRRHLEMRGPGIRPVYRTGYLGNGSKAGQYLPQPYVNTPCGQKRLDELLGSRMTWLAIGNGMRPGDVSRMATSQSDTLLIEGIDFEDPEHKLQRTFGRSSSVLVRPDRVVHTHIPCKHFGLSITRRSQWRTSHPQLA